MTELHHFHPARKGSGSLRPFPIYPLYTRTVILSLDKPIADCFLFRPRKSCEKRRKRSHTNVSNASVTRTSRVSQTLLPPLPHFHQWVSHIKRVLAQSSTKRPTFAFAGESGYTLAFANRIAHSGSQGETGGVSDGGWYLYPRSVSHVSETLRGRGLKRQTLPLLGLGRGYSRRTQKACGTAMRMMRVAVPRRRGPAGLRRPTPPAERTVLAPISPRVQLCLRRPAFPLSAFIPGA